jgi:hypothetical protein
MNPLSREAVLTHRCRSPVRRDAEQEVVADTLAACRHELVCVLLGSGATWVDIV